MAATAASREGEFRMTLSTSWTAVGRGAQRGQGMVEYALVLVLVSIVVIVILMTMGHQILNVFSNIVSGLSA